MTPHSMSSFDYVGFDATSLPWREDIWQEDGSWFTLAQLLWVKLFGSSMTYGQLNYVISAPVLPARRLKKPVARWPNAPIQNDYSAIFEMELVIDPERGILLIAEVYGQPGDPTWQPEKIYGRLMELGIGLSEFLQRESLDKGAGVFCPGFALVLRDMERSFLGDDSPLNRPNVITRDELRTIRYRLDKIMDSYSNKLDIPFHSYGHLLISALRNVANNSQADMGRFRTAQEIYHSPSLPAWLR